MSAIVWLSCDLLANNFHITFVLHIAIISILIADFTAFTAVLFYVYSELCSSSYMSFITHESTVPTDLCYLLFHRLLFE